MRNLISSEGRTKQRGKDYVTTRIDKTQQNIDVVIKIKTINHISECRKLTKKEYKTRHDWVMKEVPVM